jgi:hypothetical protein
LPDREAEAVKVVIARLEKHRAIVAFGNEAADQLGLERLGAPIAMVGAFAEQSHFAVAQIAQRSGHRRLVGGSKGCNGEGQREHEHRPVLRNQCGAWMAQAVAILFPLGDKAA